MKVSVAIATYNRAAMVRASIVAALAQSRPPDEIVVSDDASTDETFELLIQLAARNPRVRVFRQQTNLGGALNANFAVGHTRGDFIAWCSDDDRFLADHLEASVAYLETHPDVALAHSSFIDAVEVGSRCAVLPRTLRSAGPLILDGRCLAPYLIRYYDWPFHPSTLVMRREVWERVGPFNPAYALSDTDWFVRVVENFRVVMLPRYGVINRRHAGNWSNRVGSARMQREIFEIVEGSIARQQTNRRMMRMFWLAVWRANVRLRLVLTLCARLQTKHERAAGALWHGLLQHTGRRAPTWLERIGGWLIRRWCAGRAPAFEHARQSVSPL